MSGRAARTKRIAKVRAYFISVRRAFYFTVSSASDRYLLVGISQGSAKPAVTGVTWNGTNVPQLVDSTATADGNCRAYPYGLGRWHRHCHRMLQRHATLRRKG